MPRPTPDELRAGLEENERIDWYDHTLDRDWQAAARAMNEVKGLAISDTLHHLDDLEQMCERDGLDQVAADIRNLRSRLRSLRQDYEHAAVVGA